MATPREGAGVLQYLHRFRAYGRPHVSVLSLGVVLRIAELLADLAQPWPLAFIVDSVIGGRRPHGILVQWLPPSHESRWALLTLAAGASILLALLSGIFDYLGDRIMNGAGEKMTAAIRADAFAHLQRLPLAYHDRFAVGELISRVSVDTSRIEDALVDLFSTLLPGILSVIGLFVVILIINWKLGAVALLFAPLVMVTVYRYSRLTRQAARLVRKREGILAAYATETLGGIRTVQVMGAHTVHDRGFAERNGATLKAGLRAVDVRARFTPLVEGATAVGTGALLWIGGWGVLHGVWTLGMMLVVLQYTRNMLKPIRSLSKLSQTFSRGAASAERVAQVLDEPYLGDGGHKPGQFPPRAAGAIELRRVHFGYGRGTVLRDVDVTIRPGERIALVGHNGAGKSSILGLLARLYDPQSGQILLDDRPIDTLPVEWLRSQIAVVPQETYLFSGSIWDNIAYARPHASRESIKRAADEALVTDFVRDLPQGFETQLGDRGIGLSGGQQQRIAIARALLRDCPVVLLDEPTSGLDKDAERDVVRALLWLMQGRTVVMVSHRPALLSLATRVLEVRNRELVEVDEHLHSWIDGGVRELSARLNTVEEKGA